MLQTLYPPRCPSCGTLTERDFSLCGNCWRDVPFHTGMICDSCGVSLPGVGEGPAYCDDCMAGDYPWAQGRSVFSYRDTGRKLVLLLKHGDREDIALTTSQWAHQAAEPILKLNMLILPIPLHWLRLLKRRYNQAEHLAHHLALKADLEHRSDLLRRKKYTRMLDGITRQERIDRLQDVFEIRPQRQTLIKNRHILLVDDVMTTGATLSAAAHTCFAAGAKDVSILVLARATKDP